VNYTEAAGSGPLEIEKGQFKVEVELVSGIRTRMDKLTFTYLGM
jgi:hypothetical protein